MARRNRSVAPLVTALALLAIVFMATPLLALVARAPWGGFLEHALAPEVRSALWLSLRCSVFAALLSFALGLPLALWLAAADSRARVVVRVLVTLPMVLPPVVGGVALLFAFGRSGLVGGPLDAVLGVTLPFTTAAVVLAETYVALPFFVLTVEGGLRALDPRYAAAAATLGAGPGRVLVTTTLPLIAPTLRAALVLAWARALGEFGATITFAGSLEGETRTLPLAVYAALETSPEAAVVLSLLLVALSCVVLFSLRRRWWPRWS